MWRTEWGRAFVGWQRYASCMDCFLCLCVLATEGSAQQLSKACVPPWAGLGSGPITDKYLSSEPGSWRTWRQQKQRSRLLWPRAGQRHWLGPLSMRLMDHRHQAPGNCGTPQSQPLHLEHLGALFPESCSGPSEVLSQSPRSQCHYQVLRLILSRNFLPVYPSSALGTWTSQIWGRMKTRTH